MYKYNNEELELSPAELIENVKCDDVTLEEFPEIKKLGEAMIHFCVENGGIGLAAPQVGVNLNMFVWMNGDKQFQIILNPALFPGKKKTNVVEACLSYPGEHYFLTRSKECRVKFYYVKDGEMKSHSRNLQGERSFIFQHEYDHLRGETIAMKGTSFGKENNNS